MSLAERKSVHFLGVQIDTLDTQNFLGRILELLESGRKAKVMYVNADCMLQSLENKTYRRILNKADLVYADGVGVVWGARLYGYRIPGRSTAADFMPHLCRAFAKRGYRIYLLGAREGVAEEAAASLLKQAPGLDVAGVRHGYFGMAESHRIVETINAARPDVLLVGLGAPAQEIWIEENENNLDVPLIWGVGGLFDFLSGRTRRGPRWLLDNGFEWICRLIVEPRRLWRRYLLGNGRFLLQVLRFRFFQKSNL